MAQASFEPETSRSRVLRYAVAPHWLGRMVNLSGESHRYIQSNLYVTYRMGSTKSIRYIRHFLGLHKLRKSCKNKFLILAKLSLFLLKHKFTSNLFVIKSLVVHWTFILFDKIKNSLFEWRINLLSQKRKCRVFLKINNIFCVSRQLFFRVKSFWRISIDSRRTVVWSITFTSECIKI